MSGPRNVLLIGGCADGKRVTVMHGNAVVMSGLESFGAPITREVYQIEKFQADGETFWIGRPGNLSLDATVAELFAGYTPKHQRF